MLVCGLCCRALLLLFCCSVMAGVAPPLPVKQRRTQSVMSEHSSVPRLYSRDDNDADVSSQRHTISHSPADLTAALDNVLTQLNEATAPEKPPLNTVLRQAVSEKPALHSSLRHAAAIATTVTDTAPQKPPLSKVLSEHNSRAAYTTVPQKSPVNSVTDAAPKKPANMRISRYDNLPPSEDTVDGNCHVTMTSCNHSDNSDVTSGYLVSSSHEMSHYTHTSQMSHQTTVTSASSVSTSSNADAPPLPVKKHSKLRCLVVCSVL